MLHLTHANVGGPVCATPPRRLPKCQCQPMLVQEKCLSIVSIMSPPSGTYLMHGSWLGQVIAQQSQHDIRTRLIWLYYVQYCSITIYNPIYNI